MLGLVGKLDQIGIVEGVKGSCGSSVEVLGAAVGGFVGVKARHLGDL